MTLVAGCSSVVMHSVTVIQGLKLLAASYEESLIVRKFPYRIRSLTR